MFNSAFLITPVGLVVLGTAFLLAILHVLSSSRSLNDLRIVRNSLLEAAKKQSLRSFSVLTSVASDAYELLPLLKSLDAQDYQKLQLIVFVDPKVKRGTLAQLKRYRKEYSNLDLKIISGRRSIADRQIARQFATGEYLLRLNPSHRLTPHFFNSVSYSLINGAPALRIRLLVQPEDSLTSGFYSLLSLWSSLFQYISRKSLNGKKLTPGVVVERNVLSRGKVFSSQSIMYEETAITIDSHAYRKLISISVKRAYITLLILAVILAALLFTYEVTPLTVFLNSLLLLSLAYIISAYLLLFGQSGLTMSSKVMLTMLMPFYPFWITGMIIAKSILTLASSSVESRRSGLQKLKPARLSHTR